MGQMENTSQIAKEFAEEMEKKNRKEKITNWMPVGILVFLIVMLSVVADGFLTMYNFRSILSQLSILLVMSMGLTFVILIGGTDLSGEGLGGFVGAVVSLMVLNTKTSLDLGVLAILIAVAAGVAVGIISGLIHVKGMLPSFMVTYAISSVMAGFAVLSYKGTPAMIQDELFTALSQGSVLGIPYLTLIALVIFLISYFLLEHTRFGSYVYAIGDNEGVARNTGINIEKVKIKIFAWSGFCIGVAGVMGAIRVGRGDVSIGTGTVFPAITAVVVGVTSLSGGKGGVLNSLVGAFIVTVVNNGLILLGVSTYVQSAVQGLIIIAAVALSVSKGNKEIVK